MQVSKHQPRQRSATHDPSNPFNDAYSSYAVPTLSRNAPLHSSPLSSHPPPPPPKASKHSSQRTYAAYRENTMDSSRDPVARRPSDTPPRSRVGRSQTGLPHSSRPPLPPKRSLSQQPEATTEKESGKARRAKADAIDRLDDSGKGEFHHEGPFDVCNHKRNRGRNAPIRAFEEGPRRDQEALNHAEERLPGVGKFPVIPYDKARPDGWEAAFGLSVEAHLDYSAGGAPNPAIANSAIANSSSSSRPRTTRSPTRNANMHPPRPIEVGGSDDGVNGYDSPDPPPDPPRTPQRRNTFNLKGFLGRRNHSVDARRGDPSPVEDPGPKRTDRTEAFVLVHHGKDKDKSPPTPPSKDGSPQEDPLQGTQEGGYSEAKTNGGVLRKPSLLKKIGGVVRDRTR